MPLVKPILWGAGAFAPLMATVLAAVASGEPTAGAITGWTSFGLAGAILGWLFFWHLPAKDTQIKDLVTAKDMLVKDQRAEFLRALDAHRDEASKTFSAITAEHKEALKYEREINCERFEVALSLAREASGILREVHMHITGKRMPK